MVMPGDVVDEAARSRPCVASTAHPRYTAGKYGLGVEVDEVEEVVLVVAVVEVESVLERRVENVVGDELELERRLVVVVVLGTTVLLLEGWTGMKLVLKPLLLVDNVLLEGGVFAGELLVLL
jgi:hypothetical protein